MGRAQRSRHPKGPHHPRFRVRTQAAGPCCIDLQGLALETATALPQHFAQRNSRLRSFSQAKRTEIHVLQVADVSDCMKYVWLVVFVVVKIYIQFRGAFNGKDTRCLHLGLLVLLKIRLGPFAAWACSTRKHSEFKTEHLRGVRLRPAERLPRGPMPCLSR